jgi:formamidopyrimidine-DNA glycosylase
MPELPEVETIRRDLAARIINQPIAAVHLLASKTAQNPAAFFKKSLVGKKFLNISRRGKLLIFQITANSFLLIHLKMTGQLIYLDKKVKIAGGHSLKEQNLEKLPSKHTRAIIEFKNSGRLFFNDLRRFGYLKIVSALELEKILKLNYGPEPLTKEFTFTNFKNILTGRRLKIKVLLLNQKLIAGLGNIYVDESLFAARINPERIASRIKPAEIKKLYQAINQVIKRAIKYRGTTFNNYVDSRGEKGSFSSFLKVYGRAGEKCINCGRPIQKKKIAGRGTHYCASCQK